LERAAAEEFLEPDEVRGAPMAKKAAKKKAKKKAAKKKK
jgi:hypothetical protein